MRLLRKITYGEFSEFVHEKKVHITYILNFLNFFIPDKELSNTRNVEAKLSNIKTELLEATLQLDRDQLASDKSTTYAQKVRDLRQVTCLKNI